MTSDLSLELGLPHLGRNNLSESALLKLVGHARWLRMQELGGVPSSQIHDDMGARLYATFFFVELHMPAEAPLRTYGENHNLSVRSEISHFGGIYLDGRHFLDGSPDSWVRTSNVFIYQERGPAKLSISTPANLDFSRIPELDCRPDSLDMCREAKEKGAFWPAEPDEIPLFEGSREYVYKIDIDRDLNVAGLVYFANFVAFLDLAEREVFSALPDPVPSELMNARSPYARRLGFFGNACDVDRLHISLAARMRMLTDSGGRPLLDLAIDYRMRRSSDDKEILISSCRKSAPVEPDSEGLAWCERQFQRARREMPDFMEAR